MKPSCLLRLAAPALAAGLVLFVTPAASAQSASTYVASAAENFRTGDYDKAIAEYSKALELNSGYLGAYNGRGLAKCRQGNYDGAVADFTAAIKLKPAFVESYFNRANAEFLQGNMDAAVNDFTKVIELKPDHGVAYFQRGLARQCQTNFDGAGSDYMKAAELHPGNSEIQGDIRLHAALLLKHIGGNPGEQLKTASSWTDTWRRSLAFYLTGRLSEAQLLALAEHGDADAQNTRRCESWYFIGESKLTAGDKAGAKGYFQKAFDASGPTEIVHRLARVELDRL